MHDTRLDELASELHAALLPLLQSRPDNPLLHAAAHIADRAYADSTPAAAAYRRLRLCPPEAPPFADNLHAAFELAAQGSDGVPADAFGQLVALLTSGLAPQLAVQLQRMCSELSRLTVDFGTFRAAARACLLLEQLGAPPEACTGRSFAEAEARELLLELLEQVDWLAAMELPPLRSAAALRPLAVDGGGRGLDAALDAEARSALAERLIRTAVPQGAA
ncbi:hypothetical protein Rsub_01541 [Raphidocelis subcapitata]|uniref:Uncharacterized protein n=1 Tax=Raphidocelis subcapitata TaxID=307507 RepID=A0A2V0NPZ4_9CHLO|nr:hypothetical protein Rsub_01541 [Raphidocelis subcapitata]|eukprot:GBF88642.1 hypothetical protein Rsub_01541 [Raphidocelis subcapitata]